MSVIRFIILMLLLCCAFMLLAIFFGPHAHAADISLAGTVAPNGTFPIARDTDLLGGYRIVADTTARDAIATGRRTQGMVVHCNSDGNDYRLGSDLTTWTQVTYGVTAHSSLTGLTSGDDHTQYLLLAGRSSTQTMSGSYTLDVSATLQGSESTYGNLTVNNGLVLNGDILWVPSPGNFRSFEIPQSASGAGTKMSFFSGKGANATSGNGSLGGSIQHLAGDGGDGNASFAPGNGGATTIKGGSAGLAGTFGGNANGGAAIVDGGPATNAGLGGRVDLGVTNASAVNLSRSGKLTTVNGLLTASQAVTFSSTLNGNTLPTAVDTVALLAATQTLTNKTIAYSSNTLTGVTPTTRTLTGGTGISAIGDLSADRTISLANTAVTAGSYTTANITVDAQGRITAASSGSSGPSAANPTASLGLSAINGSATTFMRSDAAPALSVGITPTWTGLHTFNAGLALPGGAGNAITLGDGLKISSDGLGLTTVQNTASVNNVTKFLNALIFNNAVSFNGNPALAANRYIGWTDTGGKTPYIQSSGSGDLWLGGGGSGVTAGKVIAQTPMQATQYTGIAQTVTGTSFTVDTASGEIYKFTATGNVTSMAILTTANHAIVGETLTLVLTQNAAGTATWPTTITGAVLVGGSFVKSAAANAVDTLSLVYDGATWRETGRQTIADSVLSSNVALLNSTQSFTGSKTFTGDLIQTGSGAFSVTGVSAPTITAGSGNMFLSGFSGISASMTDTLSHDAFTVTTPNVLISTSDSLLKLVSQTTWKRRWDGQGDMYCNNPCVENALGTYNNRAGWMNAPSSLSSGQFIYDFQVNGTPQLGIVYNDSTLATSIQSEVSGRDLWLTTVSGGAGAVRLRPGAGMVELSPSAKDGSNNWVSVYTNGGGAGDHMVAFYANGARTASIDYHGSYIFERVDGGLVFKSGISPRAGTATLAGGTVTVSNTNVTANSLIFFQEATTGGTPGVLSYTKTAGTGFTINSSSGSDTSTVNYVVVETF